MTDDDRLILHIAGRFYRRAGALEQAIVDETGMSAVRF